ncbi:hypothetical protein [uncultured Zoogloea sp.]|uniref:hypothetical protein n=1 Tax=uncultured Zoogloea sp. TaxID=160237 RepID=UPI00261EFFF6|nr:hypothetical protein [uncultured Zoogloea sp.]
MQAPPTPLAPPATAAGAPAYSGGESAYNHIYRQLVQAPNDMMGIVAYARYKQQKIEWIQGFQAQHGRDPNDAELSHFNKVTNTPTQMQGYRLQAKEIIDQFVETTLEQATREIEQSYVLWYEEEVKKIEVRHAAGSRQVLHEYKQAILTEIPKAIPGFFSGLLQNILANVAVVILGALMLLVVWSNRYGLLETLAEVGGYKLQPAQAEADPSPPSNPSPPKK